MVKKDFIKNKALYLIILPMLIYYAIFHYGPMYGALIAFKDYTPRLGVLGSPWVGFKHFVNFFSAPSFFSLLSNTITISLTMLVVEFPAAIILALLMNELKSQGFSKVVQNISYMPHFISLVVVCGMVKSFSMDTGVITNLLSLFGAPKENLLLNPSFFVPIYVGSGIWQEIGWNSIIYLAALTGVNPSLYEAASIDGAGKLKQLWHVTLPGILPTIIIMLIMRMGGILNVGYEKIILLYNDVVMDTADVISTYVYRKGLLEQSWSFSTAVNMFNSVINLMFLVATNIISKKLSDTSLW
ncbi:MAG: sugar ABC transporter permease [Ruminococcaceae bacterium]|nr:sugar ABC transporter permease [Oscillospiraceae bacterium]